MSLLRAIIIMLLDVIVMGRCPITITSNGLIYKTTSVTVLFKYDIAADEQQFLSIVSNLTVMAFIIIFILIIQW